MADFYTAHKIVMGNEGGYANDPDDYGGETYKGIARKKHPEWDGWPIIDRIKKESSHNLNLQLNANELLQCYVHQFYKLQFWDALRLDDVKHQGIANELYDTGVNMGLGRAALFLQEAINITNRNGADYPDIDEDGDIGPETLRYLNAHQEPQLILKIINCLQGEWYVRLCKANPRQEKFVRSWFSRVAL